jgi:hypothetical protein
MGSEELYHYYNELEYNQRLPKHLQNKNQNNEEENYRKSIKPKVQQLDRNDKGRECEKTCPK